jgi:hypothetical protein
MRSSALLALGAVCGASAARLRNAPRHAPALAALLPSHNPGPYRRLMTGWSAAAPITADDPTFRPVDFGADPTGLKDSSPAFAALLTAMTAAGGASHHLANGIVDLNGATIDLGGGQYLLSAPIVFPQYTGAEGAVVLRAG